MSLRFNLWSRYISLIPSFFVRWRRLSGIFSGIFEDNASTISGVKIFLGILCYKAAVFLSLAFIIIRKSVGICICCHPTCRGFSHCPIHVGWQRRSPRLYMQSVRPAYISPEIMCRIQNNYISTGIYRCSILDMNMKLCENFDKPRISVDKRFLIMIVFFT